MSLINYSDWLHRLGLHRRPGDTPEMVGAVQPVALVGDQADLVGNPIPPRALFGMEDQPSMLPVDHAAILVQSRINTTRLRLFFAAATVTLNEARFVVRDPAVTAVPAFTPEPAFPMVVMDIGGSPTRNLYQAGFTPGPGAKLGGPGLPATRFVNNQTLDLEVLVPAGFYFMFEVATAAFPILFHAQATEIPPAGSPS